MIIGNTTSVGRGNDIAVGIGVQRIFLIGNGWSDNRRDELVGCALRHERTELRVHWQLIPAETDPPGIPAPVRLCENVTHVESDTKR